MSYMYMYIDKTLLSIDVHKITKLSQFRVDRHSWKGAWLRNSTRGYRKFGLKRCQRLQRKKSWNGAVRSTRIADLSRETSSGVDSAPPPPPPQPFEGLTLKI